MQKKRCMKGLLALLILTVTVAPAFSASKPDWVDGLSARYPDASYLTGVGFGDSRRSSEDSAYAAIARIFRSEVHSLTKESESFSQRDLNNKGSELDRHVEIQSETAVSTHKVLEQVQIVERWLDPVSKVNYALAVLNRSQAESGLRQKLLVAETEAREWETRAKRATDNLSKARALHKAVFSARRMDAYDLDLRVVSPGMRDRMAVSGYSGSLQAQLRQLLNKQFQVNIEIAGAHASEIQAAILEGLHRKGFTSGPEGKLIVSGGVRFEKTGPKGPIWHFVRWSTRITLKERETGQVFGTIRRTGREGQLSPEDAERRAVTALQSELSRTIGDAVFRFILGPERP